MCNCNSCYIGNTQRWSNNVIAPNSTSSVIDSRDINLSNYIGKRCDCEFEINGKIDTRTGILEQVGEEYIAIRSLNTNKLLIGDLSILKFITIT